MSTMPPLSAMSGAPNAGAGPKALTSTLGPALAGAAGSAIRTPSMVSSATSALAERFANLIRTSSHRRRLLVAVSDARDLSMVQHPSVSRSTCPVVRAHKYGSGS